MTKASHLVNTRQDPTCKSHPRYQRYRRLDLEFKDCQSILTKATGFIGGFDYTLNPYSGCAFGCSYCYAAFFPRDPELRDNWGHWVKVKQNALDKLQHMRTPLAGKRVYMSSVTDPYQPLERDLRLVRSLLPFMAERKLELVVQTRGSLVVRDLDLLTRFHRVCVNMTVTTDCEDVRRALEPRCEPIAARLEAIAQVVEAGIPAVVTLTPLLPVRSPRKLVAALLDTGARRFVVQSFHPTKGNFMAGTGQAALDMTKSLGWTEDRYREIRSILEADLPDVREGQAGFDPNWLLTA
ncbi:MAG: radical SAM protein [Caldilineaceae bacterium]|nr:radical SAM protein [Caldilineaceae bacterium]